MGRPSEENTNDSNCISRIILRNITSTNMVQSICNTCQKRMKLSSSQRRSRRPPRAASTIDKEIDDVPSVKPRDSCEMDEIVAIITAMQEKENGGAYDPTRRYSYWTDVDLETSHDDQPDIKITLAVDERCRQRMLDWCAKMIDYFDIDRGIVFLSAYYQDRYLSTEAGMSACNDRSLFRVVSVTSLYLAIKSRVPHKWNITSHAFATLCQGSVSGEEINDMEIKMLFALNWNVNPPIPMEYCDVFLGLIFDSNKISPRRSSSSTITSGDESTHLIASRSDSLDESTSLEDLKDRILELVKYQLEIALHDKRLFQTRSSVISTASILNALEGVMNESPVFNDAGLASFCEESITTVLTMIEECNIATEEELEHVRTVLLRSVVPKSNECQCIGNDVRSATYSEVSLENIESSSKTVTHLSSSPRATSKFWPSQDRLHKYTSSPQSVLSRVFAFHFVQ